MSFLDVIMSAFVICFLGCTRPLAKDEQGFGRDTTATLRGLAMIGIVLHHIHNSLGYASPILSSIGYLATGLFFFISGYGNMLSINKRNEVKFEWIYKKILKIYIPFFVAYWVYYLCLTLMYADLRPSGRDTIIDIVSVSLPNQVSWFPKIILLCFMVHWIAKKLFNNVLLQNGFILSALLIYIAIMLKIGYDDYWYNSVLCYPVGCIFAKPIVFDKLLGYLKDKKILSFIFFWLLFGVALLIPRKILGIRFWCPVFFSLGCYYFSYIFKVKTTLLSWVGNNSFEFYLFHIVSLQVLANLIDINKYIYALLVLVVSFALVYAYLFVKKKMTAKNRRKSYI